MIRLEAAQARQRALLFDMGAVLQERPVDDGGWVIELELIERDFYRFIKRENLPLDILETPQGTEPAALNL